MDYSPNIIPNVAIIVLDRLHDTPHGIEKIKISTLGIDDLDLLIAQLDILYRDSCLLLPSDYMNSDVLLIKDQSSFSFKNQIKNEHSTIQVAIAIKGRNLRKELHRTK